MKRFKILLIMVIMILAVMLGLPLLAVNFLKSDAGMLACLTMFFAINPIFSAFIGIVSAKDIKFFWFSPILIAFAFWIFSSFTYDTAFPIVYSVIYFVICVISMTVTYLIKKRKFKD